MSFVDSASTVTVKAFLTSAGRRRLLNGVQGDIDSFITKFGLGDSDCNYAAIDAGYGALPSGFVPSPGEHISRIRSYALAQGQYKPAKPGILIDGNFAPTEGHTVQFPVGSNTQKQITYNVTTEWPKTTIFEEDYTADVDVFDAAGQQQNVRAGTGAGYIFAEFFSIGFNVNTKQIYMNFEGGLDQATLDEYIGPGTGANNGWTIQIRLEGKSSGAVTRVMIDLVR